MKMRVKDTSRRRKALTFLGILLAVLALAGWGACVLARHLGAFCDERCRISSVEDCVEIVSGKIVRANVIANHFGLTNGANLATIPFAERRERLLRDMPVIRDVSIRRFRPNRVRVEVTERTPVVRLMTQGESRYSSRAADTEGMVFWYPRDLTILLPLVREKTPATPLGSKIRPATRAAVRLVEEAAAMPVLRVQEADAAASGDYVLAVLGDSSRAKVAWAAMLEDTREAHASLVRQLDRLSKAVASKVAAGTKVWNATDFGDNCRIYANDPNRNE